ncbi:MAG: T9SS type A sorting domain-containing protein, partial [Rhodothermia bacterium]|nr:T9SS type A sorting domain-containing protein [Rhodothermia bacterium]
PNPFSDRLNVTVTVDRPTEARISLFDMLGREVAVVYDGRVLAGFKARYSFLPGGHWQQALMLCGFRPRIKSQRLW